MGPMTLEGHVQLDLFVALVCFIEGYDLVFDYLNKRKNMKERLIQGEYYKNIRALRSIGWVSAH